MASCPTETATSLNWKNSMVKKFHRQQRQKFFSMNYFHVIIFNNEFFPNYGKKQ